MQSFFSLIDHLNAVPPERRAAIEEVIWNTFGTECAVMALDMSDFSMSVRRTGILQHLRLIRRMQVLTEPIVRECGGQLIKYQADNLLAVFQDPRLAVDAAVRMVHDVEAEQGLEVAIGIDWGRILLLPGTDCFGDAVNTAYKLGEDVAKGGEILITRAVRERLGVAAAYRLAQARVSVSGLEIDIFSVAG